MMIKIDIKTNKYTIISNIMITGMYSPCTVINGILHVFQGSRNNKHLTWNHNKKSYEEIYAFTKIAFHI